MLFARWWRPDEKSSRRLGHHFLFFSIYCGFIHLTIVPRIVNAIAHDSLDCDKNGGCPDSSHLVLRLAKRNDELARTLAEEYGFRLKNSTSFLDGSYFLEDGETSSGELEHHQRRRKRSSESLDIMRQNKDVVDIFNDYPRIRVKRDYVAEPVSENGVAAYVALRRKRQAFAGAPRQQQSSTREIPHLPFPDPLYADQWYLVGRAVGNYDMNVREAWLMGYAGRGVSISILDDGIQRDHPDLVTNYDPLASTDINDHDDDPTPQNNGDNKHGTRCAGEVAAVAGNNVCGVGVAFHAKIGGVRMLDGPVSDSVEAAALSHNQDHIDIYSASWGPEDDGKTFDGPGNLAQEAFYRGIKQGRHGRGNIFVWASGNGGSRQDSCSADGYTTSIYTLSISSATYDNHRPWYLEECPSTIASTYSSANINQPAIVTVDVPNGCTKMHTGTSASAPLAAGIIALALEANPNLTWRDTQHIVLRTANPTPLLNNPGWSVNGVGRRISNKFGYGLMDAGAIVKLAKAWNTVPEQHMCTYEYSLDSPRPRPLMGNFQLNFSMEINGCERGAPVLYLEHVQVVTTIRYAKRGDLKLTLFSPSGTRSVLLPPRPQDINPNGFHKWPFLSVQMWGEDPRGIWTLMIESVTTNPNIGGMFSDWSLLLYGTEDPAQPNDQRYPNANPSPSRRPSANTLIPQNVPKTEVSEWPLNFGDVRSASDCHEECVGCTEPHSASACLSCKHFTQTLRNRAGYKCVPHCDAGFYADGDRCKRCSVHCESCIRAEVCETCHGAKLLIDTNDHYGHFDNGRCVDECPIGLVSDYTNLLQAKCVIKKNPCSAGYYENMHGNCVECDNACALCHGPGSLQCDQCAQGYGNRSLGYCRPCCQAVNNLTNYLSQFGACEDCSANYSGPTHHNFFLSNGGDFFGGGADDSSSGNVWHFLFILLVLFFGAFLCCLLSQFLCVRWSNGEGICLFGDGLSSSASGNGARSSMEYTPLKNVDDDLDLERHGVAIPPTFDELNDHASGGKALCQQPLNFSTELGEDSDDGLRTVE